MKKKKKKEHAETHPDLHGLDIKVNDFGEIISNIPLERINNFLDKHVVDKKLNEDEWQEKKKNSSEKPPAGPGKKKNKD